MALIFQVRAFSDFVLEVDGKFVNQGEGTGTILFGMNEDAHYGADISPAGKFWFHKNVNGTHIPLLQTQIPVSAFRSPETGNHITLIAQGNQIAVYTNGEPVSMLTDSSSSQGIINFAVCDGNPLQVLIDNLKVWDISEVSVENSADQIRSFADPILSAIADKTPDFQDAFSKASNSSEPLAEGASISNGFLNADVEPGTPREKINLGSQQLNATNFVLEFDSYYESGSGRTVLFVGFPSKGKDSETNVDINIDLPNEKWSIHLSDGTVEDSGEINETLKGQWVHMQVIFINTRLAFSLNGKFLGYAEGLEHTRNDIWIIAAGGPGKIRLDNIKFWNLETFASSSAAAPTSTPDPRILNAANQHSYLLSMTEVTWPVANSYCTNLGGHLVTIQDSEENDFIITLKAGKSIWLGATDAVEEGIWNWVSGELWEYTNWAGGQPDNILNREDVLSFGDTAWNDLDESISLYYICEWEPIP